MNNVIHLVNRVGEKEKQERNGTGRPNPHTRVMAITSGKGGVGKTNIVANLGFNFSRMGMRVLILDADLGLGNLDVLLGIAPRYNLSHAMSGEKKISEIIVEGPGGMKILPASSGIQEMTQLSREQQVRILGELDMLLEHIDILLIDTAAGISSNVMYFNVSAQEILVVVTAEPTSITDAYALMKVLSVKYSERYFKLLVNQSRNVQEASEVFRQLKMVSDRFLNIEIEYVGCLPMDEHVVRSVKMQKTVSEKFPDSPCGRSFAQIARKLKKSVPSKAPFENSSFFWNHLLENRLE
jgi:flagellar biosynthesis protein FlhG